MADERGRPEAAAPAEDEPAAEAAPEDDAEAVAEPIAEAGPAAGHAEPKAVQAELTESAQLTESPAEIGADADAEGGPRANAAPATRVAAKAQVKARSQVKVETRSKIEPRVEVEDSADVEPGVERPNLVPIRVESADDTAEIPVAGTDIPIRDLFDDDTADIRAAAAEPVPTRFSGLGPAPWILALSSSGVLLVALGYAGGRDGHHLALAAYWIGQVVVFAPVVGRLLTGRLAGIAESFVLVIGLAVNQYLLKWCYSPDQFRFPDELQHWLATTIINRSGELFRPNLALPPAVHFPGLAEMGSAVSQLTGLPVTAAGLIVAGVCHLGLVVGLYLTVLRACRSPATAGVTCAVYATSLHYLFFNSMYLYQTAALAFLMLTVWASREFRAGGGRPFAVLTAAGILVTTMCHHVTAGALVLALLLIGAAEIVLVRPRPWRTLIVPGAALAVVAFWLLVVARDVIAYLGQPVHRVIQSLSEFGDRKPASAAAPAAPHWQLGIQALGLLFLLGLLLAVAQDMLARRSRDPWLWAAVAGSVVFFAGNGVRFLGSNGPEIAGRLATFTYVPMSIVAGVALVRAVRLMRPVGNGWRRWLVATPERAAAPKSTRRLATGALMITVLMAGARVGGWPPAKQLLPGPYLADGFERSVDAYGTDAADWEYHVLGPGRRTGGDLTAIALASTYGGQDPVRGVGPLFYTDQWSDDDQALASNLALGYLVVDRRLAEQPPAEGQYFDDDPYSKQLTVQQLGKFDDLPQWSRLYDNGEVRIYRVGG